MPDAYFISQKQAAAAHGVDVAVIRQACTEAADITLAGGRLDKARLAEWLENREAQCAGDSEGSVAVSEIKRRRELVALKREELKLDKERDSLLPLAEFQAALRAMISGFRATINAVPGRAAAKIVARARAAVMAALKSAVPPEEFPRIEAAMDGAEIEFADIVEILQREIEIVSETLNDCAFLPSEEESSQ